MQNNITNLKVRLLSKGLLPYLLLGIFLMSCNQSTEDVKDAEPKGMGELHHHSIPPWFEKARFGVFIHFAVSGHFHSYAQEKGLTSHSSLTSHEFYEGAAKLFTLEPAHVEMWAEKIKNWGAGYAVLTASHHPGFSLWNSEVTPRTLSKMGTSKFDLVEVWCDALRENDIKVGIYFNHEDKGSAAMWEARNDTTINSLLESKSWNDYLTERDQRVKELVSNYGKIDLLWFDADWIAPDAKTLGTNNLVEIIVDNQPDIVLNNRLRSRHHGHYGTPEKYVPLLPREGAWEVCDNLRNNGLWGWAENDPRYLDYKTPEDVIYTLVDVITLGGNYLLNIGPKPDGTIPEEDLKIMDAVGQFVNDNAEAIFETQMGLPRYMYGEGSTRRGTTLYLFSSRTNGYLTIKGLQNEVKRVIRIKDGKEIPVKRVGGRPGHGRAPYIRIEIEPVSTQVPIVYKVELEGDE